MILINFQGKLDLKDLADDNNKVSLDDIGQFAETIGK